MANVFVQIFLKKRFIVNSVYKSVSCCLYNMPFYAVARGRSTGVFVTWPECEAQVKGFSGARYKKFDSEQMAHDFIASHGGSTSSATVAKPPAKNNAPNNTKKPHSTTSTNQAKSTNHKSKGYEENASSESDDLETIISKQMDDIDKRVTTFGKRLDKIMKGEKRSGTILIDPPPYKKTRKDENQFEVDDDGYVQVYTDGACSANGRSGARAGIGVYWGDGHPLNVSEPVSGRATNNCGEIQAATRAIQQALENGKTKLCVNTDSQFLINAVTKWMPGWKRKSWKLATGEPVKNEKDFKELDALQHQLKVKWNYVEAHRGVYGNEMADRLAKAGAARYNNT